MYTNLVEFDAAVKPLWDDIKAMKPTWYKLKSYEKEVEDAFALYQNTRQSLLKEQLLGETKMRTDVGLMQNFGTASGTRTTAESGALRNEKNAKIPASDITAKVGGLMATDMLRKGSVLNDAGWWTFKNDAWLMGCAHGLKVMQLSSENLRQLSDLDLLMWDGSNNRPRVLGRELVGLNAAGYKRVVHFSYKEVEVNDPADTRTGKGVVLRKVKRAFEKEGTIATLGLTFAPMDRTLAAELTFKAYYTTLKKFTKLADLQELVSSTSKYGIAYDAYEFPKEAVVVTPVQAQQIAGPILPGSTVPKKTWAQMVANKTT
jgi:hypothetical protein